MDKTDTNCKLPQNITSARWKYVIKSIDEIGTDRKWWNQLENVMLWTHLCIVALSVTYMTSVFYQKRIRLPHLKKVHLWIVLSLHCRKTESMSLNELFRIRAPWFRDDVYLKKILPLSIWTKSLLGKDCTIFTYVIEVLVMTEACYTHLETCRYDLQSAQCFQASLGTRWEVTLSFRSRLFMRFKTMAKGKRY